MDKYYDLALKFDNKDSRNFVLRAKPQMLKDQGKTEEWIAATKEMIAVDPTSEIGEIGMQQLMAHYNTLGKEAVETYTSELVGTYPNSKVANYCRGFAFYANNDFENAIKFFEKSVEIDPTYADGIYNCAYCHYQNALEKARAISGQAFIDFIVNRTEIDPNYRNNQVELGKILATIDPLANDADITVKEVFIKGFASPEASYQRNPQLAKGRTESLRQYVNSLYNFGNVITTDYEAEDWAGLRAYVEKSNLKNRDAILKIIDGNRKPDNKEWMIKRTYKEDYKILYNECYPSLRHSDYRIEYTIRSYSDPEEIKKIMFERPQNLSLQEFFLAAQTMEPGSDEFNEAFEIAVRMYPEDETANLNAANIAMTKGDLKAAERYLAKAGETKEAVYSRAAFAFLNRDYDKAEALAQQSIEMGMTTEPESLLEEIKDVRRRLAVYAKRGEADRAYETVKKDSEVVK